MRLVPVRDPVLRETIHEGCHPSGLRVFVNRKPGYTKTFAVFGTHYGSIHTRFDDPATGRAVRTPEGIAHFLEHKLFESRRGDVLERFTRLGASSNASTGFDETTYVFSASDRIEESLRLLLEFVLAPEFTVRGVEKEKKVIAQEIRMYEDDPDWKGYFNLLRSLYRRHPCRLPIGGTVASIERIDKARLLQCYRAFYHPANMVLSLSGDVDPARVATVVDRVLGRRRIEARARPQSVSIREDPAIVRRRISIRLDVSRPQVVIGWKERDLGRTGAELLRRDLESEMALHLLFGHASEHHERLYRDGIVDDSFSASHSGESDYGFTLVGGETSEPDRFVSEILGVVRRAKKVGFRRADVARARARFEGQFIRAFNSPEATAYALAQAAFRDVPLLETLRALRRIGPNDLRERIRSHLRDDSHAVSLVLPRRVKPNGAFARPPRDGMLAATP
jgi:predicted Zn-dependent peptidase